jgi:hypothetical protein
MILSVVSCSAISAITSPELALYGKEAVIGLVILFSLKEIVSTSERWNRNLNSSFNLAIAPLLLCFVAIVAFTVETII